MIPLLRRFVERLANPARALVALAQLTAAAACAAAPDGPWQLRYADAASGIEIHLRQRGDELTEFRGVVRMNERLSTLTAALLDTQRMPKWVYRVQSVTPLQRWGPEEGIDRVMLGMPWPLDDREAIVRWRLEQDAATRVVTLRGSAVPHAAPVSEGVVRMPAFVSHWRLSPLGGGVVEVEFQGYGDLGGSLASPLLRGFVAAATWEGPLHTLEGLLEVVKEPGLRQARLGFIVDGEP